MNEERFNELMRDAAETYRNPPEAPLDEMWAVIDGELAEQAERGADVRPFISTPARRFPQWIAIAATLVIGVGIGRYSTARHKNEPSAPAPVAMATVAALPADSAVVSNTDEVETSRYLGQTAALLIALPSEIKSGRANQQFVGRASELLQTTRLLIDSPASNDPSMRNLLEDLELVLAQVVRLQNNHSRTEIDLINRALDQRDVLPRLRTAVGGYSAN
jgi:hypothetical protein